MRKTRMIMGMPVTLEIIDPGSEEMFEPVFAYFHAIDHRFSPFKEDSELSALNQGRIGFEKASHEMHEVLALAEKTRLASDGYFDARRPDGKLDPSGIVKGWAIRNAARTLIEAGVENFFVDAGGDIQSHGHNEEGKCWRVGIANPFSLNEIVNVIYPRGAGVATSGSTVRGNHIYDPHAPERPLAEIVSLTVVASDVLEADRFATAAFAMGLRGIYFIESRPGLEAYSIDRHGIATFTSGFEAYTEPC